MGVAESTENGNGLKSLAGGVNAGSARCQVPRVPKHFADIANRVGSVNHSPI